MWQAPLVVLLHLVDQLQDVEEEVEDVQVQRQRGKHVLVGGDGHRTAAHHELDVKHQVDGEQRGAASGDGDVQPGHAQEGLQDGRKDEGEQHRHERAARRGEVVLGLHGVGGQAGNDACCEACSHQHHLCIVCGTGSAHQHALAYSEGKQQHEVCRVVAPSSLPHRHGDDQGKGSNDGADEHPCVGCHVELDGIAQHKGCCNGSGNGQLHCQETKHLANEALAYHRLSEFIAWV
mmetsp:Transcript_1779/g.4656  ORF Transcript_1779/g.4656 Transcript_1779/m.4656 type:complete len:234 (-) Transcript_1779:196-897(-)